MLLKFGNIDLTCVLYYVCKFCRDRIFYCPLCWWNHWPPGAPPSSERHSPCRLADMSWKVKRNLSQTFNIYVLYVNDCSAFQILVHITYVYFLLLFFLFFYLSKTLHFTLDMVKGRNIYCGIVHIGTKSSGGSPIYFCLATVFQIKESVFFIITMSLLFCDYCDYLSRVQR